MCKLFELDADCFKLVGSDLGGSKNPLKLIEDGLIGVPDAVFRCIREERFVVGEAKSRRYRGYITPYERFQLTLYLGMAAKRFNMPVAGRLRYGCGTVVQINSDSATYQTLLDLLPRYRSLVREIGLA